MDKTHICLSCSDTFSEDELYVCHCGCNAFLCPNDGGEIMTIEEFDRNKRDNDD